PDPNMVLAQAELEKAKASQMQAQAKMLEAQVDAAVKRAELALEAERLKIDVGHLRLDEIETAAKVRSGAAKDQRDATTTHVANVTKTMDTLHKVLTPRQQPQANQMPRGQQP